MHPDVVSGIGDERRSGASILTCGETRSRFPPMSMRRRSALPKGAYRIDPARPVAEAPTAGPAPSAAKPRRSQRLRSARRRFTLRNRLIVALLGVALLPLAAVGYRRGESGSHQPDQQGDDALTGRANATQTDQQLLGGWPTRSRPRRQPGGPFGAVARDPSLGPTTQAAIGSALSSDSAAGAFGAFGRTDYVGVNGHVAVAAGGQAGDLGLNLTKDPAVAAALLTVPNSTIPIPTIAGVTYDPTPTPARSWRWPTGPGSTPTTPTPCAAPPIATTRWPTATSRARRSRRSRSPGRSRTAWSRRAPPFNIPPMLQVADRQIHDAESHG